MIEAASARWVSWMWENLYLRGLPERGGVSLARWRNEEGGEGVRVPYREAALVRFEDFLVLSIGIVHLQTAECPSVMSFTYPKWTRPCMAGSLTSVEPRVPIASSLKLASSISGESGSLFGCPVE